MKMKYLKIILSFAVFALLSPEIVKAQTCTAIPNGGPYTNLAGALPCDATCGTPVVTPFDIWQNESYLTGVLTAGSEYVITVGTGAAACGAGFTGTVEVAVYEWDGAAFVGAAIGVEADICSAGSLTVTIPADGEYIIVVNDSGDCAAVGATDSGVLSVDCGANGAACVIIPIEPAPVFLTCPAGAVQEELFNSVDALSGTSGIVSSTNDGNNDPLGVICADDFVVGAAGLTIDGLYVPGFWSVNAAGLAEGNITDVTVIVYDDNAGVPGVAVYTATEVPLNAAAAMTSGYFEIQLTTPCVLGAGNYWISVEVNGDNRWNWGINSAGQTGAEAVLIDPNDVFGGGFTDWTTFTDLGLGGDLGFALLGCSGGPPPCDLVITVDQVTCDDAGTSDDASDDIIEYTVTVSGGTGTWSDAGIGVSGQAYDVATAPISVTGAGSVTVTAIDDADATCTATLTDTLPGCAQPAVPTLGQWGLMILALLLMTFGALKIGYTSLQTRKEIA